MQPIFVQKPIYITIPSTYRADELAALMKHITPDLTNKVIIFLEDNLLQVKKDQINKELIKLRALYEYAKLDLDKCLDALKLIDEKIKKNRELQ